MLKKVLNKVQAIILVMAITAPGINNAYIIGSFIINQDFIAKTLCIQKEEQKGCYGKCQLEKSISNVNSSENNNTPFQNKNRLILELLVNLPQDIQKINNPQFISNPNSYFHYTKKFKFLYLEVDTPPPNYS